MSKNRINYENDRYYSIYARLVRENLKKVVKGKVYCYVYDDKLYVDIQSNNDTSFRCTIYSISEKILKGVDSITVSQSVVKRYRAYLKNIYFF